MAHIVYLSKKNNMCDRPNLHSSEGPIDINLLKGWEDIFPVVSTCVNFKFRIFHDITKQQKFHCQLLETKHIIGNNHDYIWLHMITYDYVWLRMITLGSKYTNHSYFLNMGICSRPRSGSTSWYRGEHLKNIMEHDYITSYKGYLSTSWYHQLNQFHWDGMGWLSIHSLFAEEFSQSSSGRPCQLNRQMRQDMARMELAQLELRSSQSFTSNSFRAYKTI
jgi:hypothetical protein